MNFRASMVSLELMVTLPISSCSAPPKDQRRARMAMLVSSSWESPRPQGWPDLSRILLAPTRRSSQVSGPLGKPASVHQLVCQVDLPPVLFLHFLVDMGQVDGLLLICCGRGKKHEEVVALLRGSFGSSLCGQIDEIDVVDDDVGIV